jgi:hypothetical protein
MLKGNDIDIEKVQMNEDIKRIGNSGVSKLHIPKVSSNQSDDLFSESKPWVDKKNNELKSDRDRFERVIEKL